MIYFPVILPLKKTWFDVNNYPGTLPAEHIDICRYFLPSPGYMYMYMYIQVRLAKLKPVFALAARNFLSVHLQISLQAEAKESI